jgi:hypothetical protein
MRCLSKGCGALQLALASAVPAQASRGGIGAASEDDDAAAEAETTRLSFYRELVPLRWEQAPVDEIPEMSISDDPSISAVAETFSRAQRSTTQGAGVAGFPFRSGVPIGAAASLAALTNSTRGLQPDGFMNTDATAATAPPPLGFPAPLMPRPVPSVQSLVKAVVDVSNEKPTSEERKAAESSLLPQAQVVSGLAPSPALAHPASADIAATTTIPSKVVLPGLPQAAGAVATELPPLALPGNLILKSVAASAIGCSEADIEHLVSTGQVVCVGNGRMLRVASLQTLRVVRLADVARSSGGAIDELLTRLAASAPPVRVFQWQGAGLCVTQADLDASDVLRAL